MIEKHLVDADIQQFVLDKAGCSLDIVAHIHECAQCQAKAETYKLLFTAITEQPTPVFDFDLSATVLERVRTEKPVFPLNGIPGYLVVFSALAAAGIPAYLYRLTIIRFFKTYILGLASGISSIVISLVIITFLIFLIFQCIEMYKKYQRKIDDPNFY